MSNKKHLLYLSTTPIWGGSEVLWTQSAKEILKEGYKVRAGLQYPYEVVKDYIGPENYFELKDFVRPPQTIFRVIQKLGIKRFPPRNLLHEQFEKNRPGLVVISQGNNTEGYFMMKACIKYKIPFITITHLVTPDFWPSLNDGRIDELISLYRESICNYFVSKKSLSLHNKMLGIELSNSDIVYNPFIKSIPEGLKYPQHNFEVFKVALIGRIETFHKGYDILIEVLKSNKWQDRPIQFSLFGTGPHIQLLKRLIDLNNIRNMKLHGHQEDISEIWKDHQILLMPSRMEGQSLSLIEAMKFARPVIATDVGGTSELVEDGINGFLAAYPTPEALDDALERAWIRRTEWEQLGLNAARSIAEKHPRDPLADFNNNLKKNIYDS